MTYDVVTNTFRAHVAHALVSFQKMEDTVEDKQRDIEHLTELLEDSEKRYEYTNDTLKETGNRELSISLSKEKEDRLRMKVPLDKANENRISLNRNLERVSQLENEVDELTKEKSELFELLENEKEKNKLLQSELELLHTTETCFKPEVSTEDVGDLTTADEEENENFLHNIIVMLKSKLDAKETECNELEDNMSAMHEELIDHGEQFARARTEFEQQLKKLQNVLSKERHLNSLLSEESDQTVGELQTNIQEKEKLNTKLQDIHIQVSKKMVSMEEQCTFYKTKLEDTEEQLHVISSEYEQSSMKEKMDFSSQVSECDLAELGEGWPAPIQNDKVYQMFIALWTKSNIPDEQMSNGNRHKLNIIRLLQNGFKNYLGDNIKT